MIERVISGGQTGADQAGWRAARAAGIATGGWMPKGFLTEGAIGLNGLPGPTESHPEFFQEFGAREHSSRGYPPRTRANAHSACVTIWFGTPNSSGGKLTIKAANEIAGTFVYVVESPASKWTPAHVSSDVRNAFEQQIHFGRPSEVQRTVNIAGNRESSSPGIGAWVEEYLTEVFRLLKEGGDQ